MGTNLAWYDASGTPLTAATALGGDAGVPGTVVIRQLINNKGGTGADATSNARLQALFDEAGTWVLKGTPWSDQHFVQVRIEAGGWNVTFSQSDWLELGADRIFDLPDLANDEGVKLGFRILAPPAKLTTVETIMLDVIDSPGVAVSSGINESVAAGIYCGIGDQSFSWLVTGGDVIETGTPDANANVPFSVWIGQGKPYSVIATAVNIPLAAATKERYDLLSLDAGGTGITRTAGAEVPVGTATDADKPTTPVGDVPQCYILRGNTGNVTNAIIENVWTNYQSFYAFTSSGLTATLSAGPTAVVDNSLVFNSVPQTATLTDNATNYLWLERGGTVGVTTDGTKSEDRSLALYEIVTAAGVVTTITDRRFFNGAEIRELTFQINGEITSTDERYLHLHDAREGWIFPVNGFALTFGTNAVGASAGQTEIDLEKDDGGTGAFASIFGTGTTKPQIAYDATNLRDFGGALPDDFRLPPNARLRAQVNTPLPTGATTEAKDVTLTVLAVF